MKCAIFVLLVTCSASLAGEPQQPAAEQPLQSPPTGTWQQAPDLQLFPEDSLKIQRKQLQMKFNSQPAGIVRGPSTCYFIRTVKPMTDADAGSGFIRIQAVQDPGSRVSPADRSQAFIQRMIEGLRQQKFVLPPQNRIGCGEGATLLRVTPVVGQRALAEPASGESSR